MWMGRVRGWSKVEEGQGTKGEWIRWLGGLVESAGVKIVDLRGRIILSNKIMAGKEGQGLCCVLFIDRQFVCF